MINFEAFRPAPELTIDIHDAAFQEPVAMVSEHLGRLGANHFMEQALRAESYQGTQHLLVGAGEDISREAAILMPGTYGNGIWPHLVARAEAIFHMSAQAGLRDQTGDLVPVLMVAAPSKDSTYGLKEDERRSVTDAHYVAVAKRHTDILSYHTIGEVYGLYYSQAAVLAAPMSRRMAPRLDVRPAVVGEIPLRRLGFPIEGMRFKAEVQDEDIAIINELFKQGAGKDFKLLAQPKENIPFIRSFGKVSVLDDLLDVAEHAPGSTFVHATDSMVTPLKNANQAYYDAGEGLEGEEAALAHLIVKGTNHSLADRVGRWSTIVAALLTKTA